MKETIRKAMDAIPNREEQNKWMISAYNRLYNGDLRGLARQVNDTVNPVARARIRHEKFNKAFQEAFDEEFRMLVPEIEDELSIWAQDTAAFYEYMPISRYLELSHARKGLPVFFSSKYISALYESIGVELKQYLPRDYKK